MTNDIWAERYILASMLQYPELVDSTLEDLQEAFFYDPRNRAVLRAMKTLRDQTKPIDQLTVGMQVKTEGCEAAYVSELTDSAVSKQIYPYISHLQELHGWRVLEAVASEVAQASGAESKLPDLEAFRDSVIDKILDVGEKKSSIINLGDLTTAYYNALEVRMSKSGHLTGSPTGYFRLDDMTCGFQKQNLIVLGARPSVGKSAMGINILDYLSVALKKPTLMFSLEMSKTQVEDRIWAARSNVDLQNIAKGRLSPSELERVAKAGSEIDGSPILIDDSASLSIKEIRTRMRRVTSKMDLSLVVVDYLQLMKGTKENREQEISEVSRGLKSLAKEFDVPILALCQLNREVENRSPPIPRLSDLRESGGIEQDADVAMFLYRQDVYERDRSKHTGKAMLIVAKQRNGPTGIIPLTYSPHVAKFFGV